MGRTKTKQFTAYVIGYTIEYREHMKDGLEDGDKWRPHLRIDGSLSATANEFESLRLQHRDHDWRIVEHRAIAQNING